MGGKPYLVARPGGAWPVYDSYMPTLSPGEIYSLARNAGFPAEQAVKMTAIALRESSGKTDAFNGDASTGDRSYGLWQINMYGNLGPARMRQFGLTNEAELLDPQVNARAAYQIWNGNDKNLDVAWYINRPGIYQDRYAKYLPTAMAAAASIDASPTDLQRVDSSVALDYTGAAGSGGPLDVGTGEQVQVPNWVWAALLAGLGAVVGWRLFA